MRNPTRILGLLLVVALGGAWAISPLQATGTGSVIFVDCTLPVETPGNFKTLTAALQWARESRQKPRSEFGAIVVAPCTYQESLTGENAIDVKGLQWISRAGRDKTKIIGAVEIIAKNVLLVGFDVDASGAENALAIKDDFVAVSNSKFHNAAGAGILITKGAEGVILLRNEIFNNGGEGVKLEESANARLEENKIASNGSIGIFVGESSDRAVISRNQILLNKGEGVFVTDNDGVEISNNELTNNAMDGIKVERANSAVILKNHDPLERRLRDHPASGSDNTEVRENELSHNSAGRDRDHRRGALRQAQHHPREYHRQQRARGSRRASCSLGDVSGNVFLKNSLLTNGIGVKLAAGDSGRAPSNNTFQENSIKESQEDGISVQQSDGRNTFRSNEISGNNGSGHSSSGGARATTRSSTIVIQDNGKHGVSIAGASRHIVRENHILSNGEAGVLAQNATSLFIQLNEIRQNEREGVKLVETRPRPISSPIRSNPTAGSGWHPKGGAL
jgi:parallel beta-helix repeat protein